MKNSKAFTLTELIIVIILIGIIAGFAVPNYGKAIRKAHERDAIIQLTAIHAANLMYQAQQRTFLPQGAGDLNAINTGLNLNIIANGMTYTYQNPFGVLPYAGLATWIGAGATFRLGVSVFHNNKTCLVQEAS